MPKIKHIARFTTPVDVTVTQPILQATNERETTPIRRKLPEKLRSHIEQLQKDHELLLDLVAIILEESEQPLTVIEITRLIEIKLNKTIDSNSVRVYLQKLCDANRVSCRIETSQERSVRAAGSKVRALHATLWWAPAGEVPERTITEAVPGIILSDKSGRQPGSKNKKSVELVEVVSEEQISKNPVIDYLIDKIVSERTSSLQEELAATKQELERLQRKIRNLVGEV
ncbi:MAG: hypothetical protein EB006_12740 [Betaproteobacteria bacterium]|nr:hypothetical protein [Betaproteobacteria bacterium]